MSGQPRCYAVRQLNPFQGMVQVAELEDARALSLDGVHWEIQVQCEQPEHTWRSSNQGDPEMRYLRFGTWSHATGLRRVPLSPILDLDLLLGASAALTEQLFSAYRVYRAIVHRRALQEETALIPRGELQEERAMVLDIWRGVMEQDV